MITLTKAISYNEMKKYADGINHMLTLFTERFDNVWIVSITDPDMSPLFPGNDPHIITLQFSDIDPADFVPYDEADDQATKVIFPEDVLFSDDQAKKVADFIHKANTSNPNANDLLLANCMAGVSRSGAVVDFTRSVCGIDYDLFKRMNPQICPNAYVRKKLEDYYYQSCDIDNK